MPGAFEFLSSAVRDQLISVLVGGAVTATVAYLRWQTTLRLPARRTWRYDGGDQLAVVVAASAHVDTGTYQRPHTGIGQVRAMSLLVPQLVRAYRNVDLEQVRLSSQVRGRDLEADLLTLGGPKNNSVTEQLLARIQGLPFTVTGTAIDWGGTVYDGQAREGRVVLDFGYVVRAPNPFCPERRIVVIAGSHTFGTVAAARWMAEHGGDSAIPRDVAVLVEADVLDDGHVISPRMLEQVAL
ncbi:hypothetical protein ABZY36_04440 [Streptomyces sp. NPDC006627]|uniref:hypothetical protein n=1 Tax=Streptomyces sp. NPDC006627 TaxID=3154679 RepID=UPI0033ACA263